MKKSFYIITAAALSLVACSRNQEVDVPDANLSIFARTESPADTKTVVESGVHVYWEPGDEIAVFMGEQSAKFTTDITAASGTATFKGTFGDTTWPEDLDLWAVYPFSEDAVFDGETITTVLPSEQVAREGSFGKDMNLAIAHSNSSTLQFYNVGGGIRFSVTEEGIKKVMFEGLSGEIISGKVKIGFEDGFPVVKEVSGGSQFITLLPPAGSETFQKDTWYYIVAIPGALEGGYKLRFYKDSDYARKVSEKTVEIKRSIYGSVEKADSGIDFEPKTTHFPRTEEEIDYSLDLAESIAEVAQRIVDTEKNESQDGTIDAQAIADALLLIDGVIYAEPSSDVAVKVMQKDSLFFNVVLQSFVVDDESKTRSLGPISSVPSKNQALSDEKGICTPQGKEAIILMPVYDEAMYYFRKDGIYDYGYNLYSHFKQYLENCGYHVDEYKNDQASLERFRGKKLQDYDVVFIHSHGGYNLCLADGTGEYTGWMTATQVKDNVGKRFFGVTDFCDSCISLYDGKLHYWITMPAIKRDNPSFHNTFFYIFACHGARKTDMYLYLCERGAAAYCGHTDVAKVFGSPEVADAMLFSLTSGQSLWDAYDWTLQHTIKHDGNIPTHDLVHLHCYQENKEETFYLFDPYPYDLSSDVNGSKVTLKWKLPLHSGRYSYQLYIKDSPIGIEAYENETNEYTYEYTANSPGSYSWYVKSNLRYNGEVISSYRTDGEDFTIEEESSGNNVIYYTTSDGQTISPRSNEFGVKLLSNEYRDGKGILTFDGDVPYLGYAAFLECTSLTSIIIPDTVTSFGEFCFQGCNSLTRINIPEGVTSLGNSCFCACSSLDSILLPESVTSLGDACFYGCKEFSSFIIPNSVSSLGVACFQACSNLKSITIPESVTSIGDYCFVGCSSLTSIIIPESVTTIGSGCFSACSSLVSINLPNTLTRLDRGLFDHCSSLASISIPESVTSLGDRCFWCCSSLTSIVIPDSVTSLGKECFFGCTSLTSISIPNSISSIGDFCFHRCSSLTSFRIPESLTSLGEGCLYMCSSLTSITIPESITSIGEFCFSDCSSLTSIIVKPIMPPSGGTCMFQCTNGCPIYVPANSYYDYIEAPFWDEEAWRIQAMGGPNPNDEGVDLGLSVNWAAYNLGAWLPEEYGDYYAWGETSSKQSFSWENYDLCYGDMNSIWKYTYDDQLSILDRYDDAATCNLEGNWRMPTKEEWEELIDNCSWKHYTRNGVDGMLATSTVQGYSSAHIFFPFSGQKDGDELRKVGSMGYYWTSSLSPFSSMGCIGTTTPDTGYLERYIGLPIRPVYDEK